MFCREFPETRGHREHLVLVGRLAPPVFQVIRVWRENPEEKEQKERREKLVHVEYLDHKDLRDQMECQENTASLGQMWVQSCKPAVLHNIIIIIGGGGGGGGVKIGR